MKKKNKAVTRSEIVCQIAEMLEDVFGDDKDVWYSVDIKTEGFGFVRMNIKTIIEGEYYGISMIFDPSELSNVKEIKPSVMDAMAAVVRCKADPSLAKR